jgi:D-threo-aldose 1-dehydrogenase
MNAETIGATGVRVTRIGCGGAPLGGLFHAVSDDDAAKTLEAAWRAGIRYFDTAPLYGSGLSERRLGRFFKSKPRGSFTVSTKVGRVLVPKNGEPDRSGSIAGFAGALPYRAIFDFSSDGVRRSLEGSLERLGLSSVDIVYLHDPDEHFNQALDEAYPALQRLRDEGLTRAVGVGMNQWQMLARFVRECNLDAIMLAGRYTLLDHSAIDELLPLCVRRNVRVVIAGAFNSGILANARRAGATYEYRLADPSIVERAARIEDVCKRSGVSLAAAAIQFPLAHPAVASVVLGMRSPLEVQEDRAAFEALVPPALWIDLEKACLI